MKFIATLLLLVITTIVIGQTKYGFKIGANLSGQYKTIDTSSNSAEKIETKTLKGFQIGVFLNYTLNKKFSLAAEANYSFIGSRTKYEKTDFIVNPDGTISGETNGFYTDRIQQIDIPIFLQYNIDHFYLGVGPAIGINVSARIENLDNHSFKNTDYNPIDFSATGIIGYSIYKKIDLTLKYNYGLININKTDYAITKNRVLNFSVLFSLK